MIFPPSPQGPVGASPKVIGQARQLFGVAPGHSSGTGIHLANLFPAKSGRRVVSVCETTRLAKRGDRPRPLVGWLQATGQTSVPKSGRPLSGPRSTASPPTTRKGRNGSMGELFRYPARTPPRQAAAHRPASKGAAPSGPCPDGNFQTTGHRAGCKETEYAKRKSE